MKVYMSHLKSTGSWKHKVCFTNTTKQRFTHSAFCIWKPSPLQEFLFTMTEWFSINSIFLSIFMSFSQSSKQFLSVYIDSIICSVPFYSFTQLFASRTYAAKIKTHINYFVNLPILRPSQRLHTIYHLFFKACILQWPYAKLSTEVVQYLLFS